MKKQPMFARVKGCEFEDVLGELNDWNFVTIEEKKDQCNAEELSLWHQDVLTEKIAAMELQVGPTQVGVIAVETIDGNAPDGFKLVTFTSKPYTLQEEHLGAEETLPVGTVVVKGKYWKRISGLPPSHKDQKWCQPPNFGTQRPSVIPLRHVLSANVSTLNGEAAPSGPPPKICLDGWLRSKKDCRSRCRMVDPLTLTDLTTERHIRNKMEIVDVNQVAIKESVVEISEADRALAAEEERQELELKALAKSKRQIASYLHTWEKPVVPVVPAESVASREEEK